MNADQQRIAELEAEVAELKAVIAELRALLSRNSSNSSMPPSSDCATERAMRAAEAGKARSQRKALGHLVEGATVHHWKAALGALTIAYPDRLTGRI